MPLGRFLLRSYFLFWWSLAPDFPRPNKYALQTFGQCKHYLQSLGSIRQNLHERRCRKLLGIQWPKNLFDESKDKDAKALKGADSIGLLDLSLQNKHYSTLKCMHFFDSFALLRQNL